ncbi:conserved hypothetical protein [Thiomonas sp. X19]|uniref:pyrimidine/purine nucleoside phosphorylase n=1 Tax=Thiomonas sp. X19 TaxID=1050370 RepID=UPI000B654D70|nr:pyrimidine/purine nucleoside phosphorylase [Thiomonas sp. X19]SCC95297.1 conserved hypothetical protein [Thiomonas sp. X19]
MHPSTIQAQVTPRANVYFDGRCVSHDLQLADGSRKSVGVILAGSELTFNTGSPEIMEGVGGSCEWRLKGAEAWLSSGDGQQFSVPANASFDIRVGAEPYHYICHFG